MAVLLLIFFHPAMIFGDFDWYIQNNVFSDGLTFFVYFVHQWHMPLFFLLSGAATYFVLNFKTWQQYLIERSQRLLIPLLFGIIAIVPPQIYCASLFKKSNSYQSYLEFYPNFFKEGTFQLAHLWFLEYLVTYCLIALPFFLIVKRQAVIQEQIDRFAKFCSHKGGMFLLAIPLGAIDVALRSNSPNLVGGVANFTLCEFPIKRTNITRFLFRMKFKN